MLKIYTTATLSLFRKKRKRKSPYTYPVHYHRKKRYLSLAILRSIPAVGFFTINLETRNYYACLIRQKVRRVEDLVSTIHNSHNS